MDELEYISLSSDRIRAQVIAEACRTAGLEVKLLLSDDSGYGPIQAHRLLVRADQRTQVMAVIEKSDIDPHAERARRGPRPRPSVRPDPPTSRD
jgi:hypothetical protein